MSALASIITYFDRNPVEATATATAIGLFIMTYVAFVVCGIAHMIICIKKTVRLNNDENPKSLVSLLWAQCVAFVVFSFFCALFPLLFLLIIELIGGAQVSLELRDNWPYFIEFAFYLIIIAATIYIIPTTWVAVSRYGRQKKYRRPLSLSVGIITLIALTFFSTAFEGLLLFDRLPGTDITAVWISLAVMLAVFILVDVGMYLMTYRTLKTATEASAQL